MKKEHLPTRIEDRIAATAINFITPITLMFVVVFYNIPIYTKIIVVLIGWVVTNPLFLFIGTSDSFGKWIYRAEVRNTDLTLPSKKKMFLRQFLILVLIFSSMGLYLIVNYLIVSSRIDRRTLHDQYFNTIVVNKDSYLK